VVWLNTNEEVNVIARYAPWDGLYMVSPTETHARMIPRATTVYHIDGILDNSANSIQFHCHNLIHEDHEMMAAMNVTALADLGYDEKTTFIDPMEQRYRAKGFAGDDFDKRAGDFSSAAIEAKVKFFNDLDAYRNVIAVESRLEDYWQTASSGSASSSTSSSSATPSALAAPSGTTLATSASSSAASGASTPAASVSSSSVAAASTTSAPAATVSTTTQITSKATSTIKKADDKTTKKTTTTKK
jgi:bilirubin oxidase